MGKSRAEIQKAYRQRLKEKNAEEYLRKERERARRNYVPSSALSENDRKRRNKNNREKLKRLYDRKKQERQRNVTNQQDTSGYESMQGETQERGRIRVRLQFPKNKGKGTFLRWRRELRDATSRIRTLEQERTNIEKKFKSSQRALQRLKKKKTETGEITPRKQTENMMHQADLSECQREKLRKTLLLGNVIVSEVKEAKEKTPKCAMKAIHRIISGKIVKKYKCAKLLAARTGMCRHKLSQSTSKDHQIKRASRFSATKKYKNEIELFMKREDNSKLQPGKADTKKGENGEKMQVYVLTDYLANLFDKFRSENPDVNVSFASFCRCRPKHILTTASSSRSSCLCTKHQNAALMIKTLRRFGIEVQLNPEKAIENLPCADTLNNKLEDNVTVSQWTRVEVEEKGKKKSVTKIVESKHEKGKFVEVFQKQMKDFEAHTRRVKTQYEQIRHLKKNLGEHDLIIQLDFAENYNCRSADEVQSAYFNQTGVTLHPTVVYFKKGEQLEHKSFIIVSDETAHRASTVIAFITELIPLLKEMHGNIGTIHYWSDSPTSQYRNKHIFDMVANHESKFGMKARWNFFEAGHGKGPCDGLGGTCKRLADEAARSGRAVIQDAEGFHNWAVQSTMTNVRFLFVSTLQCETVHKDQEQKPVKPVNGTMKVHAVVGLGNSNIKTREVSCYCDICISGQTCDSWNCCSTRPSSGKKQSTQREMSQETTTSMDRGKDQNDANSDNIQESDFVVEDFVAAIYESKWYIGKIINTDTDDNEFEVEFMETKKQYYQWPKNADIIWIKQQEILCKISSLTPTGKSQRMFRLPDDDKAKILEKFEGFKANQNMM